MDRLGRAISVWLDNQAATQPLEDEALLAAHPDLRELLEPLLAGEQDTPAVVTAGDIGDATTLDDFRIVREIGRGGMGVVYEALQLSLDRRVALKLLPDSAQLSPKVIARFKREALTVAQLDHPGIVHVLAVGESERGHWFAMDLLEGVTLDEFARRCRADDPDNAVRDVVDVIAAVAEALAHAHAAGVIHRDIKPSNVIVRADGQPVITDFGVARATALPSMTQTGELAGTPFYVSPEQVAGAEVDARSDVFSLGVTLYELLTRQRPFDGDSSREVLDRIARHEPPSPDRVDRDLPRDLSAIVVKALEKEPARRYVSAAAMADDLRRFLSHRPVLAQPVGALGRLRRWTRREPLRAAFAVTLLIAAPVVAGLMTYVWWTQRATDIGRDALRQTEVEEILLDALVSKVTPGGSRKASLIPRVLELAPDDPYVLANVAINYRHDKASGPARALALLEARPAGCDDPGLDRLAAYLRRLIAAPDSSGIELAELDEVPRSALDAFVLADLAMKAFASAGFGGDNAAAQLHSRQALRLAWRAVGQSPSPRAQYFALLNRAGRCAGDGDAVLTAVDAMTRHWPDSAGAWVFRAMGWQTFAPDAEIASQAARRSLELAPDNLPALEVLADAATQRGDDATAAALLDKMERLYPKQMAWRRAGAPHVSSDHEKR
ncbi:MAG: protein kinase [Planctomycetes bacterium]|nr:protein kinase [Planctomycetota bacterium]